MKFEINYRDAGGRICKYSTNHGIVTTPNLMPVINPNKLIITPKEMKKLFGTEIIITNAYIINKDKKLRQDALENGVHKLIDFDGPIMTDSGTFQSYVYGDVKIDPEDIVRFQRDIGSDIGTILDIFGKPDQTRKQAEDAIKETISRAKRSVKIKGDMALACTIQGSVYHDLRTDCAKKLSEIESDFFPIGGVVPLMENQDYLNLTRIILASKKGLNPAKPVHLFGAGHPMIFPLAVALGCDFFDSAAYAKYANDKRFLFSWGTEKLEDLEELPCHCPVCSNFTVNELKKLDETEKVREIAKHNLYVSFSEIKKIRNSIRNGSLWELVERRANANPYLLLSIEELKKKENKVWLEMFEPISKKSAVFYTGSNTIHRPLIYRCHNRILNRYKAPYDKTIVFPETNKPYYRKYSHFVKKVLDKNNNINFLVNGNIGPIPLELDEMYPFAQSIFFMSEDNKTENYVIKVFKKYIKNKKIINWEGNKTIENIKSIKSESIDFDRLRISAIADMQFGRGAGNALLDGEIRLVKSKKTGKIRNIYLDSKHILSMRASDGMFSLKMEGGKILHRTFKSPKQRVIINKDAASFIKEGKSVFSKFVIDCDSEIRPYDECLIVDEKDCLLAVGRCLLNKVEMLAFDNGVAVKLREHI